VSSVQIWLSCSWTQASSTKTCVSGRIRSFQSQERTSFSV